MHDELIGTLESPKRYSIFFDSVDECIDYSINAPHAVGDGSHGHNVAFYGTRSFEEAIDIIKKGEPFPDIHRIWGDVSKRLPTTDYVVEKDLAGYAPDVVGFIGGRPDSMYRRREIKTTRRQAIKIIFDMTQSCGYDVQFFRKRGKLCLTMYSFLQSLGYIVELEAVARISSSCYGYFSVPLITPQFHLDLNRVAAVLCHASFFRRIIFAVMERCPGKVSQELGCNFGYGRPDSSLPRNIPDGTVFLVGSLYSTVPESTDGMVKWMVDTLRKQKMSFIADEIVDAIEKGV